MHLRPNLGSNFLILKKKLYPKFPDLHDLAICSRCRRSSITIDYNLFGPICIMHIHTCDVADGVESQGPNLDPGKKVASSRYSKFAFSSQFLHSVKTPGIKVGRLYILTSSLLYLKKGSKQRRRKILFNALASEYK